MVEDLPQHHAHFGMTSYHDLETGVSRLKLFNFIHDYFLLCDENLC
jgi:hypothetical protein